MNCHSKKYCRSGFTLAEVGAGLIILGIIASSLLAVLNKYMDSATNAKLKMQAFELVREKMEVLLASNAVTDFIDYGFDPDNPDLQWETAVESFYEPLTSRMWIRGICSATYIDTQGEEQKVELTHWLTDVSKRQMIQIAEQRKKQKEYDKAMMELDPDYVPEADYDKEPIDPVEPDIEVEKPDDEQTPQKEETICGYTMEQLMAMPFEQMFQILWTCDEL